MDGGYDDGYEACPCFWGREPSSLVTNLAARLPSLAGLRVLDAGCGEGKNAFFFAERGAIVDAVDVSERALANAGTAWPRLPNLTWKRADVRDLPLGEELYDIVVAYGLLHCLPDGEAVLGVLGRMQALTRHGGHLAMCAFNNRSQDLRAHPGFRPTLLQHAAFERAFAGWLILETSDADLVEQHPHNDIVHSHSLTRVLAQRKVGT